MDSIDREAFLLFHNTEILLKISSRNYDEMFRHSINISRKYLNNVCVLLQ